MTRWRVLLSAVLVACFVVGAATTGAATHADEEPTRPTFAVALQEDGSARVTLTTTFDLATEVERRAFRELRDNTTALAETRAAFADRLERVADRTASRTSRAMSVTDPAVSFRSDNGTGYVELSATWTGLARTNGSQLVVTAPFGGGCQPSQAFAVYAPPGVRTDDGRTGPRRGGSRERDLGRRDEP